MPAHVREQLGSALTRSLLLRGGVLCVTDHRGMAGDGTVLRPRLVAVSSLDVARVRSGKDHDGPLCHAAVGKIAGAPARALPGLGAPTQRVVTSVAVPCGVCTWCGRGLASVCPSRRFPGMNAPGYAASGAALGAHGFAVLPSSVHDDAGLLAPFVAGAAEAVQRAAISERDYVTVLGDGVMGLLAAQIAARANPRVRLLGKHAPRYSLCERWGIKHRHVREAGKRQDQDVVIDCTGRAGGLLDALGVVRPGGRVVIKGPPCQLPGVGEAGIEHGRLMAAMAERVEVVGAGCGTLAEGVKLLAAKAVDTAALLTRRFPMSQAAQAFAAAGDRENVLVVLEVSGPAAAPGTVGACESA